MRSDIFRHNKQLQECTFLPSTTPPEILRTAHAEQHSLLTATAISRILKALHQRSSAEFHCSAGISTTEQHNRLWFSLLCHCDTSRLRSGVSSQHLLFTSIIFWKHTAALGSVTSPQSDKSNFDHHIPWISGALKVLNTNVALALSSSCCLRLIHWRGQTAVLASVTQLQQTRTT